MFKVLLRGLCVCLVLSCLATAQQVTMREDGTCLLKNRFLNVVLTAEKGGRIISFTDLRSGRQYTASGFDDGMGCELDWNAETFVKTAWYGRPYIATVVKDDPTTATVEFKRNGSEFGGNAKWLTVTKRYSLGKDSTVLWLDEDIAVHHDAMGSLLFCLWNHNCLKVADASVKMIYAGKQGIKHIPYDANSPANESFNYDLTDGWVAVHVDKEQRGLCLQADYRDLMSFYNWQGASATTAEFLMRSQTIKNGTSYRTRIGYGVYGGLSYVHGAGNGYCGEILRQGQRLTGVKVYCPVDTDAELVFSVRKGNSRLETEIVRRRVRGQAGETVLVQQAYEVPEADGYELNVRMKDGGGKTLFRLSDVVGNKNGYVRVADVAPRGNLEERFGKSVVSEDRFKDCFEWHKELPLAGGEEPWLKAYSGGRIRLLALTSQDNGRELIELANRMDAELTTCSFSTNGRMAWHPNWGHNGGNAEINVLLKNLLKKHYDCILLAGIQMDPAISKDNQRRIAEKVRGGTGLVGIMPTRLSGDFARMFPAQPMVKAIHINNSHVAPVAQEIQVLDGAAIKALPVKHLPEFRVYPYAYAGKAACTAAGKPLMVSKKYGDGSVSQINWLVGRDTSTLAGGVMPFLKEEAFYPWQNVFYGMVVKAIQNVSGRTPEISLEALTANADNLGFTVANGMKEEVQVTLSWKARHENGTLVGQGTETRTLKPGMNRWTMDWTLPWLDGVQVVEVRMSKGKVGLDFGAQTFAVRNPLRIETVSVEDKLFKNGETMPVEVTLSKPQGAVTLTLVDYYGRTLYEHTVAGQKKLVFTIPLQHLYANFGYVKVSLQDGKTLVDQEIRPVDMVSRDNLTRDADQFQMVIGWPRRFSRHVPFYLHKTYASNLRKLGYNAVYGQGISMFPIKRQDTMSMTFLQRAGFRNIIEALARIQKGYYLPYYGKWVESDYNFRIAEVQKMMKQYSTTHDTKYLRRNPQLDSDEYLRDYSAGISQLVKDCRQKWFPHGYDLADEFCYTWANAAIDLDFSPESLKKFRSWLKGQYASLEDVNREWKREYTSWDEVTPDTGWEARQRGVYSGWFMHRLYNVHVFVNFIRVSCEAVRKVDPTVRVSMSGTRSADVYTGCDWSQLLKHLDSLHPYDYDGQGDMQRSFKKAPYAGWAGYGGSDSMENTKGIWNQIFNGHYGISVFSGPLNIAPDLEPTAGGLELQAITRPLREGLGNLFYHSNQEKPAVAIYYSMPSIMASWITKQTGERVDALMQWMRILKERGVEFRYVSSQDVEAGALAEGGYKILIMPYTFALSDRECTRVNDFVKAGGCVWADLQPAVYNEHGAPAESSRLAPAFSSRNSWLLGEMLPANEHAPKMKAFLRKLEQGLARLGVNHGLTGVTLAGGKGRVRRLRLADGRGELLGIINDGATSLRLSLKPGAVVYDLLNRKKLSGCELTIKGVPVVALAVLDYEVSGMTVQAQQRGTGLAVSAQVLGKNVSRHAIRFTVKQRNASASWLYDTVKDAPAGRAEHVFYPALNEGGDWLITAEDVISGKRTAVKVQWQPEL